MFIKCFALLFLSALFFCNKTLCADNYKVIIVGAGPAGTAAASRLLENNINDILVLEAEPRPGGRIYSTKFGDGYVDAGAQYCHGSKGNIVYDLVKDFNLLVREYEEIEFMTSSGEVVEYDLSYKLYEVSNAVYKMDTDVPKNLTARDFYMSR